MKKRIITLSILIIFFLLIMGIAYLLITGKKEPVRSYPFPNVELMNLEGEKVILRKLHDKRPTFVLYFNTECEYCEAVIADMLTNHHKFDNCRLIFVSLEEIEELNNYIKKQPLNKFKHSEIYSDYKMNLSCELQIESTPTYFIFNEEGKIIRWSAGVINTTGILKTLQQEKNG